MSNFCVVNILELMESIGEDNVNTVLSDFSCSRNVEIERFIRNQAVDFAKRKIAITYFVVNESFHIIAAFTLTHKAVEISADDLSKTTLKKVQRFAQIGIDKASFTVSAFLIAQFGKNDFFGEEESISGNILMDYVFDILSKVQHDIGGGIVYLECENKPKLLEFYQNEQNHFRIFGKRYSELEGIEYLQLLRFF